MTSSAHHKSRSYICIPMKVSKQSCVSLHGWAHEVMYKTSWNWFCCRQPIYWFYSLLQNVRLMFAHFRCFRCRYFVHYNDKKHWQVVIFTFCAGLANVRHIFLGYRLSLQSFNQSIEDHWSLCSHVFLIIRILCVLLHSFASQRVETAHRVVEMYCFVCAGISAPRVIQFQIFLLMRLYVNMLKVVLTRLRSVTRSFCLS